MSDPVTNVEIEDVLSSIRRLVSQDGDAKRKIDDASPSALILTEKERVDGADAASEDDISSDDFAGVVSQETSLGERAEVTVRSELERAIEELETAMGIDAPEYGDAAAPQFLPDLQETEETHGTNNVEASQLATADEGHGDETPSASNADDVLEISEGSESAADNGADRILDEVSDDDALVTGDRNLVDHTVTVTGDGEKDDVLVLGEADMKYQAATLHLGSDLSVDNRQDDHDGGFSPEGDDLAAQPANNEVNPPEDTPVATRQSAVGESDHSDHLSEFGTQGDRNHHMLDEEVLRDLVAEIVRSELQGELGERITRNVRKLVRREINRALAGQDLI